MGKDSTQIVIDENAYTVLNLNGKKVNVGKISLYTSLKLIKFLKTCFTKYQKEMSNFVSGETEMQDILTFVDMLDVDEAILFLDMILELNDVEFCKTIKLEDVIKVYEAFVEHNDIGLFLKKVQGLIVNLLAQVK